MKKIRFINLILCVSLVMGVLFPQSVMSADNAKIEIPYADSRDTASSPYWYKQMNVYSQQEAKQAGVPDGYSGYVMKLAGDSASGITADFSERNIPATSVKSIHFRVYYGSHTKEVRVTTDAGVSWVLRYNAVKPDQWDDVVLSDINEIKKLANSDGRLGKFGFGFRNLDDGSTNNVAYIDEIRVELTVNDDIPPIIRYEGPDHIETTEGKPFVLNAVGWDEQENAEFPIEYIWDKDATDDGGGLVKGDYTLTLRVTDSCGNTSERVLTVTVGERDTKAPVIDCKLKNVKALTGAYVKFDFKAQDDRDDVEVIQTWSKDALDKKGRITEGTHTLTLTSSDLTGNTTTITVTVTASKTLD